MWVSEWLKIWTLKIYLIILSSSNKISLTRSLNLCTILIKVLLVSLKTKAFMEENFRSNMNLMIKNRKLEIYLTTVIFWANFLYYKILYKSIHKSKEVLLWLIIKIRCWMTNSRFLIMVWIVILITLICKG